MAEPRAPTSPYPILGVLVVLSALFGMFVMPRLGTQSSELEGKPAPDFTLPVVANGERGARLRLADLRGRVVILDFWASWCGPCAAQAPVLDELARRYDDELVVVGINVGESPAVASGYARAKGLSYAIVADPEGEAQGLYAATSLPTVVVIDKQGTVKALIQGFASKASLEREIERLF